MGAFEAVAAVAQILGGQVGPSAAKVASGQFKIDVSAKRASQLTLAKVDLELVEFGRIDRYLGLKLLLARLAETSILN